MLYSGNGNKLGIEYLNTALRLEPTNINVLYALAQTYQDAEEADIANEYYVKMLEIDPQNKYAWFNRGRLELELYEDYDAAVDFFTKAIDSDPNFAEAHYNRGVSYEMMGDKNRAEACYITAKNLGFDKAENEKMKVKH
jgi:tetratricopeptide (TPR) repeat protein